LMYRGGLNYMCYSVSDTAEGGEYGAGPQGHGEGMRRTMQKLLGGIQLGEVAKERNRGDKKGRPQFEEKGQSEREAAGEQEGATLRKMMAFLDGVTIRPGD